MRHAYFTGCKIPHHLPEYGAAVEAVCAHLGIELVRLEFSCCGWPVRHESETASVFAAARNLALAARAGLPVMTPCKCCFGNLKYSQHRLDEDSALAAEVRGLLAEEGLELPAGPVPVAHLLNVVDREVGAEALRAGTVRPLSGVKVACHYGCHALRPGNVTGFDDPLAPTVFERLMAALGAEPVHWDLRLECCGHPLRGRDDAISTALMRKKLENAAGAGADVVATGCTYCQLQFDRGRDALGEGDPLRSGPPAVLAAQLMALALGLDTQGWGVDENHVPWHPSHKG